MKIIRVISQTNTKEVEENRRILIEFLKNTTK